MKILVIDDDPDVRAGFELALDAAGHELQFAADRGQAEEQLKASTFDVVLLDQNLEGPGGGPVGLALIDTIRTWSPAASIVIVSGYWQELNAVEQALERGADDYLVKGAHLNTLLRAKLDQLDAALTAQRRSNRTAHGLEQSIQECWRSLQSETDSHRKGRMLEDLLVSLLQSVGGLRKVIPRHSNNNEEFDSATMAEAERWHRISALWLFECKNWSRPVGRGEADILTKQMERRHEGCSFGVLVAWSGVTVPLATTLGRERAVVAVVQRGDLQEIVAATPSSRADVLHSWFDRAVLTEG